MADNQVQNKSYSRLAGYYDLIHSDKDYKKETEFINFVLEKMSKKKVNSLLDVACGTGSHAEYLKKQYFVIGIDSSKAMLDLAKKKVKDVDFFREDMRDFKLDRTFDAVLCLNDSFSYNLTDEEVLDSLRCFANHLENDGLLIFDALAVQPKEQVLIDSYVDEKNEVARISKWKPNLKRNSVVEYVYLVKTNGKEGFHVDHHEYNIIHPRHIKRLMKKAGFKDIHMLDGFSTRRYRRGSPKVVMVGRLKK